MADPTHSGRPAEGAQIVGTPHDSAGPGPRLMLASTLEGNAVINPEGEKLGTIEAIMLDVPMGRIAYAVLSSGGFLGLGDKLFAIPWSALTLDTDNKCFLLDVSKEELEKSPGFDKEHWPSVADRNWRSSRQRPPAPQPYWE